MHRIPLQKQLKEFALRRRTTDKLSGEEVKNALKFTSLVDILPRTSNPALIGCDSTSANDSGGGITSRTRPLTHFRLVDFISNEFNLKKFGLRSGDRVGVCLPQGPELAVCILATVAYCTCIPINPASTEDEIKFELGNVRAKAVIILDEDSAHIKKAALELEIVIIVLRPNNSNHFLRPSGVGHIESECGLFTLHHGPSAPLNAAKSGLNLLQKAQSYNAEKKPSPGSPSPFLRGESSKRRLSRTASYSHLSQYKKTRIHRLKPTDVALILHTSGTTGTKKIVPILLEDLCVGAFCVAVSMELSSTDICCNMMPLFHVGGIVRNVFAPLLAGGAFICMPTVDPVLFWDLCAMHHCTWYYAAPTIHMMLIEEAKQRHVNSPNTTGKNHNIRIIANAAGGLLPSVAEELRNTFGKTTIILPSYGMTECMPISCPPSNYQLDRAGTSGIPVGPEVTIRGEDSNEILSHSKIGRILVRGIPVMRGYENNPKANNDAFFEGGWFDTGDMGYLDADGYLYLTGRSKEVINRGGEIISPFDVEDVVMTHPSVKATVAFSVPHDKLQETIGVVIVTKTGFPRISLKHLHHFISDKLQPAKWPQVIVYMDNVVRTNTNKVQRIGLAARMNLKEISDSTPEQHRMLEAICPPKGTSLKEPISASVVSINIDNVTAAILKYDKVQQCFVKFHQKKIVAYVVPVVECREENMLAPGDVLRYLRNTACLHDYLMPAAVTILSSSEIALTDDGALDMSNLPEPNLQECVSPRTQTEKVVHGAFSKYLKRGGNGEEIISIDADFFESGGDSMKAGQLVSLLRKEFSINLPSTCVFVYRTVEKLAANIEDLLEKQRTALNTDEEVDEDVENQRASLLGGKAQPILPHSQTHPLTLLLQGIPLVVGYPIRRVCSWFLFLNFFAYFNNMLEAVQIPVERLIALMICLFATKLIMSIVLPLLFILVKWCVIFKYKPGRYPLWGNYYLRWWMVDQFRKMTGRGIFKHFAWSLNLYYRMLGAKVGWGTSIDKYCTVAEYDLLDIGSDCVVESRCLMRPFTADGGAMLLKEIKIGNNSHVHKKVSLAPGAIVPEGTTMPPMSSSYEIPQLASKKKKTAVKYTSPEPPHWAVKLFFGQPILLTVKLISMLPVFAILIAMADTTWHTESVTSWELVIKWFLVPQRIFVYLALRPVYKLCVPIINLMCCVCVKWLVVGRFRKGPIPNTQQAKFKYWLMNSMFGGRNFFGVAGIIGSHYEGVSWIYRMLGAKVGKRIYWPGSGVNVIEFDLFEVGDDVVFGSRTVVSCSSATHMKPVKLKSGCNVADRCYISPGVTVGEEAVLGSGTIAGEDFYFPPKSVWIGSGAGEANCLDRGEAADKDMDEMSRAEIEQYYEEKARPPIPPSSFGEAFYLGKAPYYVIPIPLITLINILWQSIVAAFFAFPVVASLLVIDYLLPQWERDEGTFLLAFLLCYIVVNLGMAIVAFSVDIVAKWALLGQRVPGEYSWNQNSYCQRWQLYLAAQRITHAGFFGTGILEYILGSAYLVWYFRALGCKIGKNVCLYPTGGDPMMTEPDLVTLGDNVAINNASVVGHINSRGKFRLNRISIREGATLRSYSRLLSGAQMDVGSKLLEHTLIMGGDNISAYSVWQGWPASFLYNLPQYIQQVREDDIVVAVANDKTDKKYERIPTTESHAILEISDEQPEILEIIDSDGQQDEESARLVEMMTYEVVSKKKEHLYEQKEATKDILYINTPTSPPPQL